MLEKEFNSQKEEIEKLEDKYRVAGENGLFLKDELKTNWDKGTELIAEARKLLEQKDLIGAKNKFTQSELILYNSINSANWKWRFHYAYGISSFLYLTAILSIIFIIFHYQLDISNTDNQSSLLCMPYWPYLYGAIGACLRGYWFLSFHINRVQFRKHWLISLLSAPIIGSLLSAIAYLLFSVGIFASSKAQIEDNNLPIAICLIAGYNWQWINKLIDKFTELELS
jgi:hypothetical protein